MKDTIGRLSSEAKAGAVVAALGFIISINFSSSESFNGVVTSCSYFDLAALAFGSIAILLAGKCALEAQRNPRYRNLDLISAAALFSVGSLHLVRAFGVVGGAC